MGFITQAVTRNKFPCEGPKVCRIALAFSGVILTIPIDLYGQITNGTITDVQGIFIDNADNAEEISVTVSATGHRVVCPAYSQGFFPLFMQQTNGQIVFASIGAVTVNVHMLNIPIAPEVWSTI